MQVRLIILFYFFRSNRFLIQLYVLIKYRNYTSILSVISYYYCYKFLLLLFVIFCVFFIYAVFLIFPFWASFFKKLFNYFIIIILLYNIALVLPYINMNLPRVYMCSPSWDPLPPPSPYHPSGSSQCTSPKHPVSCIEPGLAIRFLYDIIHVLMPFSQIIPPSPSPTESKRLFYNF